MAHDPHFTHQRGVNVEEEKAMWAELFESKSVKKPLKSITSKGSGSMIVNKRPILIIKQTSIRNYSFFFSQITNDVWLKSFKPILSR